VIADILEERGRAVARGLGRNTVNVQTDVMEEPDVKAAVALAVSKIGPLDCIFNRRLFPVDFPWNS